MTRITVSTEDCQILLFLQDLHSKYSSDDPLTDELK